MKRIVIIAAFVAAAGAMTNASAQVLTMSNDKNNKIGTGDNHLPHRSIRLHKPVVSYDEASTMLTVQFSSYSHGGTVEVYHDGEKVAGITANSGTTFGCVLREYGTGNYNVIVSNGNTVIYSKNFTVR